MTVLVLLLCRQKNWRAKLTLWNSSILLVCISFTFEISATSVNFLDIKITLRDNSLHSSVYKPTDSHSYLTYTSSHPKSCKRSLKCFACVVFAKTIQTLSESAQMTDFFSACGYPIDTLEVTCSRVSRISMAESLLPKAATSSEHTKLIITYHHPQNVVAQKIIFQNLDILKADPKACKVYNEPPLVLFRRAKNMRDLLVRSRVSTENRLGTRACNRSRCETCRFVLQQSCEVKIPRGTCRMTGSFTLHMR